MEIENKVQIIDQNFFDIDSQAECLSGYDQQYQQMSCGKFVGQFKTAVIDTKISLYFEKVNQILDQNGSVPNDSYSVIFLMNRNLSCKLNGLPFSPKHLWVASPGSTFNTVSNPGTHFCVIDFDRDFFENTFTCNYPKVANVPATDISGILDDNNTASETLRQTIGEVINFYQNKESFSGIAATKSIRTNLAEMITDELFYLLYDSSKCNLESPSNYYNIWKRARDFINENKAIDISVTDLCQKLKASRRMIEYSFRYSMGKSPAAYLRSVKLNEIRRAFLLPENSEKPIADIVSDWGIWHLSRFSQYYKQQFNELPSETRKWRKK